MRRNPAAAESAWRCAPESSNHLTLLQAVGGVDDGDSDGREHQDQYARDESVAAFDSVVDGDGGGLRSSRNVARDHEGGAEVAESARERQHACRNHGTAREWQRDAPEHPPVGPSNVSPRFLLPPITL